MGVNVSKKGVVGDSMALVLHKHAITQDYDLETKEVGGCERSIKIKFKIKKTYFENKSNTILKIKDLAANIK